VEAVTPMTASTAASRRAYDPVMAETAGTATAAGAAGTAVEEGWPFWAPSEEAAVDAALDLAAVRAGERVADLGCGDGHVLVRAAQRGARVLGVESDPDLAAHAREALAAAGADGEVVEGDLFEVPLDDVDVVFTYLAPVTLQQLAPRLAVARLGTRVVTVDFPIPDVRPDAVDWPCHLYRLPLRPKRAGRPGWLDGDGVLVAAPPEVESLTTLTVRAGGGPVVVDVSPAVAAAAAVRVGAESARRGGEVAVDLRWSELPAGAVVEGRLAVRGAGTLAVVALVTPDEHGQWELDADAVARVRRCLSASTSAPTWAELLAAAQDDGGSS
jgi:SAM-dependent methyltransferase